MHHSSEFVIVASLCAILLVGLVTRVLSQWTRLPHTVLVLLFGMVLGMYAPDLGMFVTGDHVHPDLILLVFLPILVFESAFSMQVHAVRRNIGPVLWLAIPALVASTVGVAAWMVLLTGSSWAWGWTPALVFGALISATDPVAVVALLRELGAPKRLSVLIEGESLFNDGTAIVVFTILLAMLTGGAQFDILHTITKFGVVAGGGILIGVVLSLLASAWLRRTFNQPVVEITLTLMLAYLSMLLAESVHVSGVMAVVVAGLWMSGPGRVDISPEVHHFLHRFWQVLATIANTLIFFLVGLVVAKAVQHKGVADLMVVVGAFVGIIALRLGLVFASLPVMSRLAEPISKGEAAVMAWGGLRGAVSLALALMIASKDTIPHALRDQFLLVTSGVVLGTLVINGTTIGALLARLGFDRQPAADRLAEATTRAAILRSVVESIDEARANPALRTVNWNSVDASLESRCAEVEQAREEAESELAASPEQRERGAWRQAMSIERTAYWDAFARGTLGAAAVQLLDGDVDARQHALLRGTFDPTAVHFGQLPGWRGALERWLHRPGRSLAGVQFVLLELRYELARGRGAAAAAVLDAVSRGVVEGEAVEALYEAWARRTVEQLEDFRVNLPEMTEALETRVARRISLNLERAAVDELEKRGGLDPDAATRARAGIEQRMKQLAASSYFAALPDTTQLCRDAPLFAGVSEEGIARIEELTTEKALAPGEVLFEQGTTGGNLFIVARGAVAVLRDERGETKMLGVLGSGDVLGEMELLTGAPRTATIRALTHCMVGEIDRAGFEALMSEIPEVAARVREAFARRRLDNHLRNLPAFAGMGREARMDWFERGVMRELDDGQHCTPEGVVFVVAGALSGWSHHAAPSLIRAAHEDTLRAVGATTVVLLPADERGLPTGPHPTVSASSGDGEAQESGDLEDGADEAEATEEQ